MVARPWTVLPSQYPEVYGGLARLYLSWCTHIRVFSNCPGTPRKNRLATAAPVGFKAFYERSPRPLS
jgi:hypothetical protein